MRTRGRTGGERMAARLVFAIWAGSGIGAFSVGLCAGGPALGSPQWKGTMTKEGEGLVTPPDPAYAVKKFDGEMKLLAELARTPANKPTAFDAFFPALRWTIDDEDNVIYGYPKTYELRIFNSQNKLVRKIEKDYDPVKVTEAEVAEAMKEVSEGITPAFSKVHPAFRNLLADDAGRIYVQTWKKNPDGQCVTYDLFDKDGRFLAVLTLKERAMIRKDKLYTVEEDEDGFQTIKRYSVTWNFKGPKP